MLVNLSKDFLPNLKDKERISAWTNICRLQSIWRQNLSLVKKTIWNGEERRGLALKLSRKCKETSKSQNSFPPPQWASTWHCVKRSYIQLLVLFISSQNSFCNRRNSSIERQTHSRSHSVEYMIQDVEMTFQWWWHFQLSLSNI